MNADLSVAPELAQLAAPVPQGVSGRVVPPGASIGQAAGMLGRLAAATRLWWDLVRFDPDGPVRVPVPGADGAWLLVLPPGAAADCDCAQATALAGEAAELAADGTARPLRPGRVRVHGSTAPHRLRTAGHGYSVSLHFLSGTERCACFPPPFSPCGSTAKSSLRATRNIVTEGQTGQRLLERTDNP